MNVPNYLTLVRRGEYYETKTLHPSVNKLAFEHPEKNAFILACLPKNQRFLLKK